MASPFKTHETMDLARALLEEDSDSRSLAAHSTYNNNVIDDFQKPVGNNPFDRQDFGNLVISKDSSTELLSHLGTEEYETSSSKKGRNTPTVTMVRDLNAGKGLLDDDGKPAVGKVFSRVIQISGDGGKPKPLKSHHRGRSSSSCSRHNQSQDKERSSSARPQSGQPERLRGPEAGQCPSCNRQFSDETVMEQHIVFCTGSSKDIM